MRLSTVLMLALALSFACTKKKEEAAEEPVVYGPAYPVYPDVDLDCTHVSDAVSADPNAASKPSAIVIPFRISKSMNSYIGDGHPSQPSSLGPPVCTPLAMKEKINKIFQLFGSDPLYNVRFEYAGTFDTVKYYSEFPTDGTLYVNFTHGGGGDITAGPDRIQSITGSPLGDWGAPGSRTNSSMVQPTSYPGGYVSTMALSYEYFYLIHEIGHALGLNHAPLGSSVMGPGPSFDSRVHDFGEDYLAYGEHDRVNLRATAPAAGYTPLKISGVVTTSPKIVGPEGFGGVDRITVYAVNTVSGLTYYQSAYEKDIVDTGNWEFSVNVGAAGTYKVFATANHLNPAQDPTSSAPSWSVGTTGSTKDPAAATPFTLSTGAPTVSGLSIPLIFEAVPFYLQPLSTHFDNAIPATAHPALLAPGAAVTATFLLASVPAGVSRNAPIVSVEPFGSAPDYSFGALSGLPDGTPGHQFSLAVDGSAPPGDRLIVAKAASGNTVYGLAGVHVLKTSTKPSSVMKSIPQQLNGEFDFTTLNPDYWK